METNIAIIVPAPNVFVPAKKIVLRPPTFAGDP